MQKEKYMIVYDWMTEELGNGVKRDVYALLYGLCKDGECTATHAYMCERLGVHIDTLRAALRSLIEGGYIVRSEHQGKCHPSTYIIGREKHLPYEGDRVGETPTLCENDRVGKSPCIGWEKHLPNGRESTPLYPLKEKIIIKENKYNSADKQHRVSRFRKPKLSEVEEYCRARGNNINAQEFIDFYESKGWVVGKSPMKDWKAAVRTWENKRKNDYGKGNSSRVERAARAASLGIMLADAE